MFQRQPYLMYDYHVWANEQLFAHLEQLPQEAFHAEVTSVFPSVQQTFGHMYLVEQLFMAVLSEIPNEDIFPRFEDWTQEVQGRSLDEVQHLFAGTAEQFRSLFQRTPDPDRAMTIVHPQFGSLDTRFSDILLHVVNHATYHRGNITAMLRQQGYAGVATDLIFYLLQRQNNNQQ